MQIAVRVIAQGLGENKLHSVDLTFDTILRSFVNLIDFVEERHVYSVGSFIACLFVCLLLFCYHLALLLNATARPLGK